MIDKKNTSILLIVVFISTFFILITLSIDYYSISGIDIKKSSFINPDLQNDEITGSDYEKENISQLFIQSESANNGHKVIEISSSNSINLLEKLVNNVINIQTAHNSGDTIKRSLVAQINNVILILKDDDSDNDNIICNNFVNKFVSSIKLYERIGIFKPNSSSKISQDILTVKNSLCV